MITWLIGENSFEVKEALRGIEDAFSGTPEYYDGDTLTLAQLPDLLMGLSLFAENRLVVVRDITANTSLWEKLSEWLPRVNDTIHVVFIDTKPDKRTSAYKTLKAAADTQEYAAWTERDTQKAEKWVIERAPNLGVKEARHLVARVGVDQWQLNGALEKLTLLDEATPEVIDELIPASPSENVFQLFELALEGKGELLGRSLQTLAMYEDPYRLFGLLVSQALSLAAVTAAGPDDAPSKDFGIHPFVASKLVRHGRSLGMRNVQKIVDLAAKADAGLKRSRAEPWVLIEQFLLSVVHLGK